MRITNLIGIILMVLAFVGIALCVFSYLWLRKLPRDNAECMVEDVQDQLFIPIRIFNFSISAVFICGIIGFFLIKMEV